MPCEEYIIPISAISQYAYCPRRFMLMFVESEFEDNIYTIQGTQLHERVDEAESILEKGSRVERALPLWSDRLGLVGKSDLVEFRTDETICPIEYKRGTKRNQKPDDLQLCAQAICLMEMLGKEIQFGFIFYCHSKRRREVKITNQLILETGSVCARIRETYNSNIIPEPVNDGRCDGCSLARICQPGLIAHSKNISSGDIFRGR
ncbi:MAG TPA: CRISPR-associated protein Cas4 [Caldisericia bacterium]|nr:CRISPR-associated protein Cas4 [Caldisericia bacterium]HQG60334.1 CRISPR-associated protein Cas4 [Caldisericia bacterium]HQH49734.1 CRISPR-associated protein Cas4 [Caldisericia bacterium]HQJ44972.1 CRISPR-associated protein Cas4 [Caldisericia bacterium]